MTERLKTDRKITEEEERASSELIQKITEETLDEEKKQSSNFIKIEKEEYDMGDLHDEMEAEELSLSEDLDDSIENSEYTVAYVKSGENIVNPFTNETNDFFPIYKDGFYECFETGNQFRVVYIPKE